MAQTQSPDLTTTDRLVVASKIYSAIQQYFVHWEGAPRGAVETSYREYIDSALRAANRRAFALASLRFIATLRNGHTQFFDSAMDGRPLKFRLLEVEGRWVVIGSLDSRLTRGSIVRTIDSRPVDEFLSDRARYVWASNERIARTHVFSNPGLFPERFSVRLENGDVVYVDRSQPPDVPLPSPVTSSIGHWLRESELAYIRIPAFSTPAYEQTALEFVRQFSASPALIVDVRGNGGGSTPRQLTQALMNRAWNGWQQTPPPRPGAEDGPPLDLSSSYQGHIYLLVDRFCGSACEDFVMPFKDSRRGVVVGEATQGSSGNGYQIDLGHGMSVVVGVMRYRFPDGSAFEGVGIAPDVAIERRIADIVAGRDVVLERAEQLATAPAAPIRN